MATKDKETTGKIVTMHTDHFPYVRGDVLNLNGLADQGVDTSKIPATKYVKGEKTVDQLPDALERDEEEAVDEETEE